MARSKKDHIYRRENGIFAFRYKDSAGVWKEKYTGEVDREAAKKFRDDFVLGLKENTLPNEMADWRLSKAEEWWNEYRKSRIAPNTRNSESYRLQHFEEVIGNKRLRDITNQDLDVYVSKRLEAGIGAWSINKEILLWSMVLRKAKLWRRLEDDYKPLKTQTSDIGRALTRDELKQLAEIAASDEDWEAAFYGSVLAANTGIRGGEIKKLRIGAVNLEKRQITIRRSDTKSDAGARHIELNADATEAAARLLLRASKLKLPATRAEHYLMPKNLSRIARGPDKGKRGFDPTQHQVCWDTAWATLTEKAKLKGFRFHDLRHTFISHMVEKGIALGLIQAMVGHISARMLRHYTHISSGAARKAVEVLDAEPILSRTLTGEPAKQERTYHA